MLVRLILLMLLQTTITLAGESDKEAIQLALDYVSRIEQSPCTGGTDETLDLIFNHTVWEDFVSPAILTSNFLTSILLANNGSLDSLTDEMFFSLVKSNVVGRTAVFGSGIAIEPGIYSKYSSFVPYAYHKNGIVFAHDVALSYTYQDNNKTLWYHHLSNKNLENATRTVTKTKFRSGNISLPEVETVLLTAKIEDGHWTKPYFDCGGGDIWMVTFTSPLFSLDITGQPKFQGIASVDIELTNIDINQCDPDTRSYSALDVFRGTHACPKTTECVFLKGQGFKRGAYQCVCSKGYYFPNVNARVKAFEGLEVENSTYTSQYKCLPCMEGCTECDDDSPCLYQFMFAFRFPVLLVTLLTCIAIGSLSVITVIFKNELGFFAYPKASRILCISQKWVYHIGFNLMYGALVIKTWRIAIIFRPASKLQRVHLPDKELLKRFLPPMCVVTMYLLAWSISTKGTTETLETSNLLKYDVCLNRYWLYAIQCAEVCLLLAGCYMCYLVRKAPGHFNESRYITWAVYNGIILGSFLLILTHLIGNSYGPDLLYLLQGLQIQAFVTTTLTLIFIPKILALYRKEDIKKTNDTFKITNDNKYLRTNDFGATSTKSVGTQTYENISPHLKDKQLWTSLTKLSPRGNNRVEPIVDNLTLPTI
ncbi:G protein-coupled receptor 158 [Mytilus galloprovincialis]|uniref:G protein-coupled receptor 158 n=1 Tax=Mytilus galloprovincialis TaxID=29158 RepID=A0A8B6HH52_MYTGA|nr:G protein-coupled receptor 158 [Mytilus galloprovincialis]